MNLVHDLDIVKATQAMPFIGCLPLGHRDVVRKLKRQEHVRVPGNQTTILCVTFKQLTGKQNPLVRMVTSRTVASQIPHLSVFLTSPSDMGWS